MGKASYSYNWELRCLFPVYSGQELPTNRIKQAKKCVVTNSNAVYLIIVVSLKETLIFEARRLTTLPNRIIRNRRGNRKSFAILVTNKPRSSFASYKNMDKRVPPLLR